MKRARLCFLAAQGSRGGLLCSVMKTCHVQGISAKHQKKKPIPKDRLEKVRMGACAVVLSLCLDRWTDFPPLYLQCI